jgi:hypothetical protein
MVGSSDVDRPFRVDGRFSDDELLDLVLFIRTSPRNPPIPDDPDGTSHVVFDQVDGTLPVLEMRREHDAVRVVLGASSRSWQSVVLRRVGRHWKIGGITEGVA